MRSFVLAAMRLVHLRRQAHAATSARTACGSTRLLPSWESRASSQKRADSPYGRGRTSEWVKIRTPTGMEAERAKWNE
jgi:hypothetical protein